MDFFKPINTHMAMRMSNVTSHPTHTYLWVELRRVEESFLVAFAEGGLHSAMEKGNMRREKNGERMGYRKRREIQGNGRMREREKKGQCVRCRFQRRHGPLAELKGTRGVCGVCAGG